MEMSQNSKEMFAAMYKGMYGTTFENMEKKVNKAEMKAEKEAQKAEKERLSAEKVQREKEELQVQMILLLHVQNHFSIEKIVEDYKFDLEFVKQTVKKYLTEQEEANQNPDGEQIS